MAVLIDALRAAGRSDADISAMTVGDLSTDRDQPGIYRHRPPATSRPAKLGGFGGDRDPAFRTLEGEDIAPAALPSSSAAFA